MSLTERVLQESEMNIIDCIPYGHDRAIPYKKLQKLYGATKRQTREALSRARKKHIILNLQDGKGFFRPLEDEEQLMLQFLRQEEHRNKEHRETLQPLREYFYMKGIE